MTVKYVPYAKLSKREQKQRDKQQRGSWGVINPVTRKPPNSKAYNRAAEKRKRYD